MLGACHVTNLRPTEQLYCGYKVLSNAVSAREVATWYQSPKSIEPGQHDIMVNESYSVRSLHRQVSARCPKSMAVLPAGDIYTFKKYALTDESRFTRLANEGISPPFNGQVFLAIGLRLRSATLYINRRDALLSGTGETVWARVTANANNTNDVVLRSHGRDLHPRDYYQVEFYEPFVYVAPKDPQCDMHDALKALVLYAFAKCGHVRRVRNLRDSSIIPALMRAVKAVRRKSRNKGGDLATSVPEGNDFPKISLAAVQIFDPVQKKRKRSCDNSTTSSVKKVKREDKRSVPAEINGKEEHEKIAIEQKCSAQHLKGNAFHASRHEALELVTLQGTEDHAFLVNARRANRNQNLPFIEKFAGHDDEARLLWDSIGSVKRRGTKDAPIDLTS